MQKKQKHRHYIICHCRQHNGLSNLSDVLCSANSLTRYCCQCIAVLNCHKVRCSSPMLFVCVEADHIYSASELPRKLQLGIFCELNLCADSKVFKRACAK
ncbi:hypothetical protein MRX96_022279 [Rhipicephalus microplus]